MRRDCRLLAAFSDAPRPKTVNRKLEIENSEFVIRYSLFYLFSREAHLRGFYPSSFDIRYSIPVLLALSLPGLSFVEGSFPRRRESIRTPHPSPERPLVSKPVLSVVERVERDPKASPLLRILRQFVGDLFVQNVFDGKGDYALAGLFEERLYFADGVR